jgi:hypothetical protein
MCYIVSIELKFFDVFVISLVKEIPSVYDFPVLNNDKNEIPAFITMFSSFTYVSTSGFPFPPIIHEKVMNVTLSFCSREHARKSDDNEE